ncbi:hypothetical protein [Acetobacter sp.]|jgi:deoxycytidylate deaminase|uniref:hypothetical protein n=1 Tax=Acetobacter sp. TaxID=440 RepID=UPI0025BF9621|nr:hypothetical protein [Acetobacter sp.]MCH4090224.1 hypothetical protein [Acetobacter sp.]MCI1298918.1 hypothetical protein [Acetobacter sp.]MCI1314938.1 hypothetical protein [Acetobacter sp.]
MAFRLERVNYDINSPNEAVRTCLQKKKQMSAAVGQGGFNGIGKESCCAYVSWGNNNRICSAIGVSRNRSLFCKSGQFSTAYIHGELDAIVQAIEENNALPHFHQIYIEMSPCPKCTAALNNLLPDNQVVYFSFDYQTERELWAAAARRL